jgi:hypothetical protein
MIKIRESIGEFSSGARSTQRKEKVDKLGKLCLFVVKSDPESFRFEASDFGF